jgi:hypothetical protein
VNANRRPTQLSPSDPRYVDYYGRPWAKNWERYFEQGMEKPDADVPAAILDIFNSRPAIRPHGWTCERLSTSGPSSRDVVLS